MKAQRGEIGQLRVEVKRCNAEKQELAAKFQTAEIKRKQSIAEQAITLKRIYEDSTKKTLQELQMTFNLKLAEIKSRYGNQEREVIAEMGTLRSALHLLQVTQTHTHSKTPVYILVYTLIYTLVYTHLHPYFHPPTPVYTRVHPFTPFLHPFTPVCTSSHRCRISLSNLTLSALCYLFQDKSSELVKSLRTELAATHRDKTTLSDRMNDMMEEVDTCIGTSPSLVPILSYQSSDKPSFSNSHNNNIRILLNFDVLENLILRIVAVSQKSFFSGVVYLRAIPESNLPTFTMATLNIYTSRNLPI